MGQKLHQHTQYLFISPAELPLYHIPIIALNPSPHLVFHLVRHVTSCHSFLAEQAAYRALASVRLPELLKRRDPLAFCLSDDLARLVRGLLRLLAVENIRVKCFACEVTQLLTVSIAFFEAIERLKIET